MSGVDQMLSAWREACLHESGHCIVGLSLGIKIQRVAVERIGTNGIDGECQAATLPSSTTWRIAFSLGGITAVNLYGGSILEQLDEPPAAVEVLRSTDRSPYRCRRKRKRISNLTLVMTAAERQKHSDREHIIDLVKSHWNGKELFTLAEYSARLALDRNDTLLRIMAQRLSQRGILTGDDLTRLAERVQRIDL